jgi:hypothetical protein
MCRIDYESSQHRLRVAGRCQAGDIGSVTDAIEAFGRKGSTLIVDLTALTGCPAELARAIMESAQSLSPRRVSVLRKHGTEVDRLLIEASVSSQGAPSH